MTHSRDSRGRWIPNHRSSWSSRQSGWCSVRVVDTHWMRCAAQAVGCRWWKHQQCNCQLLEWKKWKEGFRWAEEESWKSLTSWGKKGLYQDMCWSYNGPSLLNRFCPHAHWNSYSKNHSTGGNTGPCCDRGLAGKDHSAPWRGKKTQNLIWNLLFCFKIGTSAVLEYMCGGLTSHVAPVKPWGHSHRKWSNKAWQWPPFLHGPLEHRFLCTSQWRPTKPGWQTHW